MATDADPDKKKTDEPSKEIEATQPASRDFTPSERAFLDEMSAYWREADGDQHEADAERSPRARRRITH